MRARAIPSRALEILNVFAFTHFEPPFEGHALEDALLLCASRDLEMAEALLRTWAGEWELAVAASVRVCGEIVLNTADRLEYLGGHLEPLELLQRIWIRQPAANLVLLLHTIWQDPELADGLVTYQVEARRLCDCCRRRPAGRLPLHASLIGATRGKAVADCQALVI
jgi:hypothetical protein